MLVANAVVDPDQPRLQVGENQMDDRQVLLGNLWITTLGNSEVLIAALTEASIGIVRLNRLDLKNLQLRTFRLQVDTTRPAQRLGLV